MEDWHEPSCRRPDVFFHEGSSMPTCLNCGACLFIPTEIPGRQDSDDIGTTQAAECKPLRWPPHVTYLFDDHPHSIPRAVSFNLTWERVASDQQRFESDAFIHSDISLSSHFRILRLSRGYPSDPLHGNLEVVEWRHPIEYQAVSYCWADSSGNKDLCRRVFLGEARRPLAITLNCFQALRHLRRSEDDVALWIDGVCINQQSRSERASQAEMTHKVFYSATNVCVYVGEDAKTSDATDIDVSKTTDTESTEHVDVKDGAPTVLPLHPLLERSHRLWIALEASSARSLSFRGGASTGPKRQSWHLPETIQPRFRWLRLLHHSSNRTCAPGTKLLDLLAATNELQVTDLRDRIFALLGSIPNPRHLVPDYSLTIREVYIGTAAYLMQQQNSLEILAYGGKCLKNYYSCLLDPNHCPNEIRKTYGIPSWVPLWTRTPYLEDPTRKNAPKKEIIEELASELHSSATTYEDPSSPVVFMMRYPRFKNKEPRLGAGVNRVTGSLQVRGFELPRVFLKLMREDPLTRPRLDERDWEIHPGMNDTDPKMRKRLYKFPGSASVLLRYPKKCREFKDADYRVVAVDGYDDHCLVVEPKEDQSGYEVIGPCQIIAAVSSALKTWPATFYKMSYAAIDEFFPMTRENVKVLHEWRRIFQSIDSNARLEAPGWMTTPDPEVEKLWDQFNAFKLDSSTKAEAEHAEMERKDYNMAFQTLVGYWQQPELFGRLERTLAQIRRDNLLLVKFHEPTTKRPGECEWILRGMRLKTERDISSITFHMLVDSETSNAIEQFIAARPARSDAQVAQGNPQDVLKLYRAQVAQSLRERKERLQHVWQANLEQWMCDLHAVVSSCQSLYDIRITGKTGDGDEVPMNEDFTRQLGDELKALPWRSCSFSRREDEVSRTARRLLCERSPCWGLLGRYIGFLRTTMKQSVELENMMAWIRELDCKKRRQTFTLV